MPKSMETIFARATGVGKSAITIIRISGPLALKAIRYFLSNSSILTPRIAVLKDLFWEGQRLDRAIIIYFEKNKSFTGEETVEVHLHGSVAVVDHFLSALNSIHGLKPAGPGDFTRQSLYNGRMDLTEVEGLVGLINSETMQQKVQAEKLFYGDFSKIVKGWRHKLLNIKANLEAAIDFVEEDININFQRDVEDNLKTVINEISKEISGSVYSEKISRGFEVAIVGMPNVGKSTLLNHLVGDEASIVSDLPGTTRDVIERRVNFDGHLVSLFDCAGIRKTSNSIEKIGVMKAQDRANKSDLRVFLVEDPSRIHLEGVVKKETDITIISKIDKKARFDEFLGVSGKTGEGVKELVSQITSHLKAFSEKSGSACNNRHRNAMEKAVESLKQAKLVMFRSNDALEFVLEDIRQALLCLEDLIGKIDIEDVYTEIFSKFCIGK